MGNRRKRKDDEFTDRAAEDNASPGQDGGNGARQSANEGLRADVGPYDEVNAGWTPEYGTNGLSGGSEGFEYDLSGLDTPATFDIEDFLDQDSEYGKLPAPEVFNAYPPEIQRKIMEWTDRDVKARRDDESRRRDEVMRAEIDNERRKQVFPAVVTVLALICAAVTGVVTANPLFPLVFLLVPLAVIASRIAGDGDSGSGQNRRNKPPKV